MTNSLQPDEILAGIELPIWPPGHGYAFEEFARRHGDFAIAAVSCLIDLAADGTIARVALCVSGLGPAPVRLGAGRAPAGRPAAVARSLPGRRRGGRSARGHDRHLRERRLSAASRPHTDLSGARARGRARPRTEGRMSDRRRIKLRVNGREVEREVETRMTLADFLRLELELTGTHLGCEHGVCGACTVLVDGQSVRSCLMLAVQAAGRDGHDRRRARGRRRAQSLAAGVLGKSRAAMRLLHARHAHDPDRVSGAQSGPERSAGARRHLRQYLPLHRLSVDRRLCAGGSACDARAERGKADGMVRRQHQAQGRPGPPDRARPLCGRHQAARHAACRGAAQPACPCRHPRHRQARRAGAAGRACGLHLRRSCRPRCSGRPCRSWCRARPSSKPICRIASPATKPASSASRSPSWWPTAAISPRMRPRWSRSISSRCRPPPIASRRSRPARRSPIATPPRISPPSSRSMSATPMPPSRRRAMCFASRFSSIAAGRSFWNAAA